MMNLPIEGAFRKGDGIVNVRTDEGREKDESSSRPTTFSGGLLLLNLCVSSIASFTKSRCNPGQASS
jgi:hypothetical protein